MAESVTDEMTDQARELARHHISGGWWMLLVFLSLGLILETLHDTVHHLGVDAKEEQELAGGYLESVGRLGLLR